jgi:HEAT repeat protein
MVKQKVITLIEQLYDEQATVRSQAVLALGEMRHADSVAVLVHVLTVETDLNVLEDTTWALVRMGEAAVEPLIALLKYENPTVRHQAAHVLGKIGDARAVDALIKTLSDMDDAVRLKTVFALGQISDEQAISALVNMLTDENMDVRVTVADVLEQFGKAAAELLIPYLQHENWRVRDIAAEILGRIADGCAVEPLLAALQDECWQVRFTVVNALRDIGDTRAIEPMRQLLDDESKHVVAMVNHALVALKGK